MTKVIKFYILILTALSVLSFSIVSYNALDDNVSYTPEFEIGRVSGNIGDIVELPININHNSGITALKVSVIYSQKDLDLVSVEDCNLFDGGISTGKTEKMPFIISWLATDSENKTNNGTLAKLRFKILDNAISSRVVIEYNPEDVCNIDLENQSFSIKNGWVLVGDAIIGDADSDNCVNINDVTAIQRHLAELELLSDAQLVISDTNGDGEYDIADATHLQKYLAEYDVTLG